jgi:hypothetical protein
VTISRGLCNGYEATITQAGAASGVPISGMVNGVQQAAPVLNLDPGIVASGDNRSWVVLQVTPDPTSGLVTATTLLNVVHLGSPFLNSQTIFQTPLVLIIWANGKPYQAFEIAYFNFQFQTASVANGISSVKKGFFL